MYCNGELNRIDSFDSACAPPWAFEFVVTVKLENPPIVVTGVNVEAPLAASTFVTIYSNITILPFDNEVQLHHHQNKLQTCHLQLLVKNKL